MLEVARLVVEREAPTVKEMFSSVTGIDGWTNVRINYSSYSEIRKCARKAHYTLDRGLRLRDVEGDSPALTFGSAVHAALEVWYCAPRTSRRRGSAACDDSQALMASGQAPLPHESGQCVRCAAVYAFIARGQALRTLPADDKRSIASGIGILNDYFDHYADDPFVVFSDDLGPVCERMIPFVLTEDKATKTRVTFFGTIDTVLVNERTSHVLVCDHKTTSSLGKEFLQRIHPNWQYVGYVAAFRGAYASRGISTRTAMSNGIQVAKTKTSFARQYTEVPDALIAEWREALLDTAFDWVARRETRSYPMTAPDPCTQYSGCTYRTICESPGELRESIIRANYIETRGDNRVEA